MWLLKKDVLEKIKASQDHDFSAEERKEFQSWAKDATRLDYKAQMENKERFGETLASQSGGTLTINVQGVLTPQPDIWAYWFGGGNTAYNDINAILNEAKGDDSVTDVIMNVSSPGGNLTGLFATMKAIEKFPKPINGVGSGDVASAAYMLISQTDEIIAADETTFFGSVGVVASAYIDDNVIDITSSNAPKKRPDLKTEEGKAVIREELDQVAVIIDKKIASGRGVTVSHVNEQFGQGGMLVAEAAKSAGMIDRIEETESIIPSLETSISGDGGNMTVEELQAKHPGVYAAVLEMGEKQGSASFQKLSADHIKLGAACGDMSIATNAITKGLSLSETQADYMAASMTKGKVDASIADNKDLEGAEGVKPTAPVEAKKDAEADKNFFANVAANLGVELEGVK